jgi:hypothetical protein
LKQDDAAAASRVDVSYVQLVYGRQLQQPDDEKADALRGITAVE